MLSVSCSQQILTKCLESYCPLSSLSMGHSYHQRFFTASRSGWRLGRCYSALRASPCTLPRRVRTEFTSKGAVGDQGLFGTNSTEFWLQSRIYCSKPPRQFRVDPEHMEPELPQTAKIPSPSASKPILPPMGWPGATCQSVPLQQWPFGCWALCPSCWMCRAGQGAAGEGRRAILTEIAHPPGRDTMGSQAALGRVNTCFNSYWERR